jgi:uncharacterized membrane protein
MDQTTWNEPSSGERPPVKTEAGKDGLARGLGWFSLGLGIAQTAAPRAMVNLLGISDTDQNRDIMFAIGLREIASGVGILSRSEPKGWLQARVGGDVMDLALLAGARQGDGAERDRIAVGMGAVAGALALDILAARRVGGRAGQQAAAPWNVHVVRSITIRRPPEEVYAFWRDFQNLPRFMDHLESVHLTGEGRSHWRARAPAGLSVEWDAETLVDRPNELIAWRSLPGSSVPNSGQVRFMEAPGHRGTEVQVELRYDPPGNKVGAALAKLFGEEPGQQVADDLRRFKQVLETGEVIYSDATLERGMHPAQPPKQRPAPRQDRDPAILDARAFEAAASSSNLGREGRTS